MKNMYEKVMRRLLREVAIGEAAWVTPGGEVVPVPRGSSHDAVAAEVLDMKYDPDGWEYSLTPSDLLLDRGGIKARYYPQLDVLHLAARTWDDGTLRRAVQLLRRHPAGRRMTLQWTSGPHREETTTVGAVLRGDFP